MFNTLLQQINGVILGWPLLIGVIVMSLATTIGLNFIQVRKFFSAWRMMFFSTEKNTSGDMTPFEAFVNALSASIGNGSIAGIATAVYAGGPGAAFWVFVFGFLGMALRFAEVFLSTYYTPNVAKIGAVGGPMIYLQHVPAGKILAKVFALFLLFLGLASGNAMQANSIALGFTRILPVSALAVACALLLFITYVVTGGARRIVHISDKIVPLKVGLFFSSAFAVLIYHYAAIIPALKLILTSALTPKAVAGASAGFLIQQAMRYGIILSVNASEAGLGTAAVLFGGTGSKQPMKNGIMSMLGVFISANLVCFMVALMIVASGVWNNGETSLNLTISAYQTVFGHVGGWIVTILSVCFGMGVLVTYAYISRACWLFLTGGRFVILFNILFCAVTFWGAIAEVKVVWDAVEFTNAGLLTMNLFGIIWLLPEIRRYMASNKE